MGIEENALKGAMCYIFFVPCLEYHEASFPFFEPGYHDVFHFGSYSRETGDCGPEMPCYRHVGEPVKVIRPNPLFEFSDSNLTRRSRRNLAVISQRRLGHLRSTPSGGVSKS